MIKNKIKKNLKLKSKWAKKENINAYRLYDKDIPEYPFLVDLYHCTDNSLHIVSYFKGKDDFERDHEHYEELNESLKEVFPESTIHKKIRVKQSGKSQYEKERLRPEFKFVKESDYAFRVNFDNYIDTGLFLDHRPLRKIIAEDNSIKTFLNLFSYTGSFSVYAAKTNAIVTSVDMSNTYVDWAKINFEKNEINMDDHHFIRDNVMKYLENTTKKFDCILLDPPAFSNSKKMDESFSIQTDHNDLIRSCMKHINANGTLYFSNNFRKFKLDQDLKDIFDVLDITKETIPFDFKDQKIHNCFKIKLK